MEKRRHDIELEDYSQTPFLLTGPGLPIRPDMRSWVMAGGDAGHPLPSGLPLWAQALIWKDEDAAEEAIGLGANTNMKDRHGRGWLWWGSETNASPRLILSHMSSLDRSWWITAQNGDNPFHHPRLHPSVAHAMACRWWADGLSWRDIEKLGNPIDVAKRNGRWDLVSIWQGKNSLPWFTRP